MYKLDKTIVKAGTFDEAEKNNLFDKTTPIGERLEQAWYLTCMAYGIDYKNPPKMEKNLYSTRKHER